MRLLHGLAPVATPTRPLRGYREPHDQGPYSWRAREGSFPVYTRWKNKWGGQAGRAMVAKGSILLEPGRPLSGAAWTGDFPRIDYEVSVEAMRVEGGGTFCALVFPVGTGLCVLMIGYEGDRVGLWSVDQAWGGQQRLPLTNGRWYRVRLRVSRAAGGPKVEVWVEKKRIIELEGRTFKVDPHWAVLKPFGLASFCTLAAYRNVVVRRLESAPETPADDARADAWQSLFDGKSYSRNVTSRQMKFQAGRWYEVRLRVTPARIEAWIDREQVVELATAGHRFAPPAWQGEVRPFGVTSLKATAAVRSVKLRRLGPRGD